MNWRRVAAAISPVPVDDAARSQVPVERDLDDHLPLSRELLGQDPAGALVGVTVGVVEYHDGAPQQAVQPAVGQPVHGLAGGGRTVHPR